MGSILLRVVQDQATGNWLVCENDSTLDSRPRFQDARALARAVLLERGKGSAVVYTPSGRPREKLQVKKDDGQVVVRAAY